MNDFSDLILNRLYFPIYTKPPTQWVTEWLRGPRREATYVPVPTPEVHTGLFQHSHVTLGYR